MHILAKSLLSVAVLASTLASTNTVFAGNLVFVQPTVMAHQVELVGTNDFRADVAVIASTDAPRGPIRIPPHGGINPIGDVTCEAGEAILAEDGYSVFSSNCSMYIYKFVAIQGNSVMKISMSSFSGEYSSVSIGIVN